MGICATDGPWFVLEFVGELNGEEGNLAHEDDKAAQDEDEDEGTYDAETILIRLTLSFKLSRKHPGETNMTHPIRKAIVSLPELSLIAGTRVMLGAGIGLLFSGRLNSDQRQAVGWTLFTIGVISTIPLAFEVFGGGRLGDDPSIEEDQVRGVV